MFKSTLFFIMTFMMCFSAGARSLVRSHADFVHLSDYQKNQHIIKVMELVVELESKYQFETKKYGFNQNRFEKYQKAISKISSLLFIGSAHAARGIHPSTVRTSDWAGIGQKFGEILNASGSQNRCIFAGWMSETTVGPDGKIYCNHPVRKQNSAQAYPNSVSGDCARGNTDHIQCNPLIFGYKNGQSKSLFCVSTQSRAKNSSYHCMEKALGIVTEANADSREDRLETLRSNLSSNPAVFAQVQEFVYQTCVCDSTHENFNQAYQSAIRPHRTCYGLMNMIGETISCENPRLPLADHSIFENLKQFMQNKSVSESNADGYYRQFLNDLGKDTDEYRRICKLPNPTPEVEVRNYTCASFECPEGATQCDYVVKIANSEDVITFSERPTEMPPAEGGSFTINFKPEGSAASASATCEAPEAPTNYTCEATCNVAAAAETASEAADTVTSTEATTETEGGTTPPALGCTITNVKNAATEAAVEGFEKVSDPETLPTEAGTGVDLNFVLKINNENKTLSCKTTIVVLASSTTPDLPGAEEVDTNTGDDADLEVTITNKGAEAYDIKARPIKAEGWTFSWEVVAPEGKEVEESWTAAVAENAGTPGLAQSDPEDTVTTTTAEAPGEQTISQKRYDHNYQVFGVLKKEGKTDIRKPVTVDKKDAPAATNRNNFPNVNPNLQPGGGSMRGTSDTSAIGIR